MHKDLLSSLVCDLLKKEKILNVDKQKISKIIIKTDKKMNTWIIFEETIFYGRHWFHTTKKHTHSKKFENGSDFVKKLMRLLFDYEFIGNQCHAYKLEIIISAEDTSKIKIEQYGVVLHPTIFEKSEV